MADSLAGVWRLESSDDFEALMASFGVGLIMRKLAIKTVPTLTILIKNDSEWEICTEVWSNTWTTKFEIGKEFDEKLPNGKKVRSTSQVGREINAHNAHSTQERDLRSPLYQNKPAVTNN
ncbi:fatty acid-binding protein homolog 6-like isoform X4 [Varroa destructor]|uniref:Lipocalin/cytosolic fatty-acid binding domain-containing protein n=1 Tax=Varroa destructor TaxID=109461 RepID=A0A7M7L6W2_VARDE|nr:fatty acid-binding protein homolog 6-like isoform X4 [Varroa destructor]